MDHDKTGLANIKKFHYLDNLSTGEVARTIQALYVSEVNYKCAWQSVGSISRFVISNSFLYAISV